MKEGEILGFLGPNGAGKTTTLNMLSTLLRPSEGAAKVNGFDIEQEPDAVRRSIGYVFQDPTLDLQLTGRENLDFHGRLYHLKKEDRKRRIEEMLQLVQLTDRADDLVKTYSGGMKRRLEIARGLLHHPKVLFLDEPTLGLDPQTRHSIWDHIQRLNKERRITIILTTHYTEEADFLCGRILIIDSGEIVALDTSEKLKAKLEGDVVILVFRNPTMVLRARSLFEEKKWVRRVDVFSRENTETSPDLMMEKMHRMRGVSGMGGMMGEMGSGEGGSIRKQKTKRHENIPEMEIDDVNRRKDLGSKQLNLLVDNGSHRIPEIVKLSEAAGITLESVELHKPTLDDVFLSVTGRNIREEKGGFVEMARRHHILQQARGKRGVG